MLLQAGSNLLVNGTDPTPSPPPSRLLFILSVGFRGHFHWTKLEPRNGILHVSQSVTQGRWRPGSAWADGSWQSDSTLVGSESEHSFEVAGVANVVSYYLFIYLLYIYIALILAYTIVGCPYSVQARSS